MFSRGTPGSKGGQTRGVLPGPLKVLWKKKEGRI